MKQRKIESSLKDMNELILQGKMMEAFDKYYHEDVSMQENNQAPTIGKASNRKRELEFLNNITEFRGASVNGFAVSDDLAFVMWSYDYIHKEWGVKKYTQVAVQRWKDNQIIHESFYYGN